MKSIHKKFLLSLFLITFFIGCTDMSESNFDATVWKEQKGNIEKDNLRAEMITALERDYLKIGMTREKVRNLLGPPDEVKANIDRYDIGVSPLGIDMEVYQITYKNEKLVAYNINRY